jgi:hypothetical protein
MTTIPFHAAPLATVAMQHVLGEAVSLARSAIRIFVEAYAEAQEQSRVASHRYPFMDR